MQKGIQHEHNKLFANVARALDRGGREEALLKALFMPDDRIRLAVVNALYVVPLHEFSSEEIGELCSTMQAQRSIVAGQTEMVLATIMQVFTRFVQCDVELEEKVGVFQV